MLFTDNSSSVQPRRRPAHQAGGFADGSALLDQAIEMGFRLGHCMATEAIADRMTDFFCGPLGAQDQLAARFPAQVRQVASGTRLDGDTLTGIRDGLRSDNPQLFARLVDMRVARTVEEPDVEVEEGEVGIAPASMA